MPAEPVTSPAPGIDAALRGAIADLAASATGVEVTAEQVVLSAPRLRYGGEANGPPPSGNSGSDLTIARRGFVVGTGAEGTVREGDT